MKHIQKSKYAKDEYIGTSASGNTYLIRKTGASRFHRWVAINRADDSDTFFCGKLWAIDESLGLR